MNDIANVMGAWGTLAMTTAGVLITFAAGLWNIGIEGQVVMGAIFTTGTLRLLQNSTLSSGLILVLGFFGRYGLVGLFGLLWPVRLKTFGNVNEIFWRIGIELCCDCGNDLSHFWPLETTWNCFIKRNTPFFQTICGCQQSQELNSAPGR